MKISFILTPRVINFFPAIDKCLLYNNQITEMLIIFSVAYLFRFLWILQEIKGLSWLSCKKSITSPNTSIRDIAFHLPEFADFQESNSCCQISTQSNIIVEMEERFSPARFNKGSVGMDVSPMSNITNDLSRSILDSGGPEKRYLQHSKGKWQLWMHVMRLMCEKDL